MRCHRVRSLTLGACCSNSGLRLVCNVTDHARLSAVVGRCGFSTRARLCGLRCSQVGCTSAYGGKMQVGLTAANAVVCVSRRALHSPRDTADTAGASEMDANGTGGALHAAPPADAPSSPMGTNDEDAFAERDPMEAVLNAVDTRKSPGARGGDGEQSGEPADSPLGPLDTATAATDKTRRGDRTDGGASAATAPAPTAAARGDSDAIVSDSRTRRRRRRQRSVDTILADVLRDALKLRDMGHKPTADFVHKRTQERLYEEEYGHKPPSAKELAAKYIPFPPDHTLHRLLALESGDDEDVRTAGTRFSYRFMPADPWPVRAITAANPVWTKGMVEEDKQKTSGAGLREWEQRMYHPREGYDVVGEFCDAMDELAYWEARLLTFLRDTPLSQRRSLPYLHEFYRIYVHRTIRAERRYTETRNAAISLSGRPHAASAPGAAARESAAAPNAADGGSSSSSASSRALFKRTEEPIERVRAIYAEAHRSLSSPNYDPLRMKKSALAPFMKMSPAAFEEWQQTQKQRRNALIAELE